MRPLWALVWGAACARTPPESVVPASVPTELLRMAAPPREISYERRRVVGQIGLPSQPVTAIWSRVPGEGVMYDVVTGVSEADAPRVAQRLRYGADGLVIVAEGPVEAALPVLEPWVPPLVVLPTGAKVGSSWETTHAHRGEQVLRSCEIMPNDTCPDGLIVVCDRTEGDLRLIVRDRFCEGSGWMGYESLAVRGGSPAVRTWTEGLRRME